MLLLDLPDLPDEVEEDLPDLPLHQPAHLSFSDEGAFDTVGAPDHQSLLPLLLVVDLLALLVPFQSDQSATSVASVVVGSAAAAETATAASIDESAMIFIVGVVGVLQAWC